jgi:DNA-binding NarL/FixJ family response regulator
MIRVLINTSQHMREELLDVLSTDPEIVVADHAAGGSGIVPDHPDSSADVLLLEHPSDEEEHDVKVILLVGDDSPRPVAAFGNGLRAVLPKGVDAYRLLAAIHAVAAGFLLTEAEPRRPDRSPVGHLMQPLTPKEREVLRHIAAGMSNKEIARAMSISEHTAKFHVAAILGKLGASSRTEAVAVAIRNGLLMV